MRFLPLPILKRPLNARALSLIHTHTHIYTYRKRKKRNEKKIGKNPIGKLGTHWCCCCCYVSYVCEREREYVSVLSDGECFGSIRVTYIYRRAACARREWRERRISNVYTPSTCARRTNTRQPLIPNITQFYWNWIYRCMYWCFSEFGSARERKRDGKKGSVLYRAIHIVWVLIAYIYSNISFYIHFFLSVYFGW